MNKICINCFKYFLKIIINIEIQQFTFFFKNPVCCVVVIVLCLSLSHFACWLIMDLHNKAINLNPTVSTNLHQLTYFERCEKIRNSWTDYLTSLLLTKWHYATDVLNITWGAFINNNVPGTQFSLGRPMCLTQCFKFTSMGKRTYY